MEPQEEIKVTDPKSSKLRLWLKRVGVGAFLFFLAKGLVWLAVFFFFAKTCQQ
ncbi:alanyl-tRNA synthetase [Sphingobacterium pedocola]|uniref:alanyl-tRNA synthetase n=1 Tax=Sphingobacterium pedocola TaxID=2082722 RepID=UPI0018CAD321|nr:alanyl-tRNA synthetase [Sphingobacterium pedocola]